MKRGGVEMVLWKCCGFLQRKLRNPQHFQKRERYDYRFSYKLQFFSKKIQMKRGGVEMVLWKCCGFLQRKLRNPQHFQKRDTVRLPFQLQITVTVHSNIHSFSHITTQKHITNTLQTHQNTSHPYT